MIAVVLMVHLTDMTTAAKLVVYWVSELAVEMEWLLAVEKGTELAVSMAEPRVV